MSEPRHISEIIPEVMTELLRKAPCEACKGRGWLLADNDVHGLRIERCDACEAFTSDDAAVRHVATRAGL